MNKAPVTSRELKFRVRFDKPVTSGSDGGSTITGWSDSSSGSFIRHAAIRPRQGGETVMDERLAGNQPALIFVRADSDTQTITPAWRAVQLSGDSEVRTYALKTAMDMEGDNAFITMLGTSGAADA